MPDLYSTTEFEERYTYTGNDLGASWTAEKTIFRLWAPTAEEVTINLYNSGDIDSDDLLRQLPMHQDVKGTWVAEETGDLNGVYYTYLVMVDGHMCEACDPYAKTTGVNGASPFRSAGSWPACCSVPASLTTAPSRSTAALPPSRSVLKTLPRSAPLPSAEGGCRHE